MLDFNNTEIAFSAKSQSELKNAYLLFNTIKYPWLVKCASVVSNLSSTYKCNFLGADNKQ